MPRILTMVAEELEMVEAACSKPFSRLSDAPTIMMHGFTACPVPVGQFSLFVVV